MTAGSFLKNFSSGYIYNTKNLVSTCMYKPDTFLFFKISQEQQIF